MMIVSWRSIRNAALQKETMSLACQFNYETIDASLTNSKALGLLSGDRRGLVSARRWCQRQILHNALLYDVSSVI